MVRSAQLERPAEVHSLQGDATKARQKLGWEAKTGMAELVELMVHADLRRVRLGAMAELADDERELPVKVHAPGKKRSQPAAGSSAR